MCLSTYFWRIFALIRSRIVTTMEYMYYNVYFSSIFCDIFRCNINIIFHMYSPFYIVRSYKGRYILFSKFSRAENTFLRSKVKGNIPIFLILVCVFLCCSIKNIMHIESSQGTWKLWQEKFLICLYGNEAFK